MRLRIAVGLVVVSAGMVVLAGSSLSLARADENLGLIPPDLAGNDRDRADIRRAGTESGCRIDAADRVSDILPGDVGEWPREIGAAEDTPTSAADVQDRCRNALIDVR